MIHHSSNQALDLGTLPGPDTTMKQHAVQSSDPRFQAMLREAVQVGWPKAFENDLYQHDLSILDAHPQEEMLWILREHGTHLFPMECESAGQATYAQAVIRYWSGEDKLNVILSPAERPKFYLVSSAGLTEITAQTAASKIRCTPHTPSREDHA